jgi:hypothetical protein
MEGVAMTKTSDGTQVLIAQQRTSVPLNALLAHQGMEQPVSSIKLYCYIG